MQSGSSQPKTRTSANLLDRILVQMQAGDPPDIDRLAVDFQTEATEVRRLVGVVKYLHAGVQTAGTPGPRLNRPALGHQTTLGEFRILREIGRGGMGVVYEARQLPLRRRVALKVLPPGATLSKQAGLRFAREARTAGGLEHKHIVPVYAVGEAEGVPYYAMRFVEGESLSTLIKAARAAGCRPDAHYYRRAAEWGAPVADALAYAHSRGVIHRDIKPSNILLERGRHIWVTDFGLARGPTDETLTQTGDLLGTLRYMAPEQTIGDGTSGDARTDVYSLGITLYELLTLRPPFDGPDCETTLKRILLDEPTPLRHIDRRIPKPLATIIHKAIEKNPRRRYASAARLRDDLQRFLTGEPISIHSPGPIARLTRRVARHKLASAFAATLFLVVLGFGLWMNLLYHRSEHLRSVAENERQAAVAARDIAKRDRGKAEQEASKAESVKEFLQQMLASVDPQTAQGRDTTLLLEILENAARRVADELADQPAVAAAVRDTIGSAYLMLGRPASAEEHLVPAWKLRRRLLGKAHPETLASLARVAQVRHEQGRLAEAERLYQRALDLASDGTGLDSLWRSEVASNLGTLFFEVGRLDEAEPLLREAWIEYTEQLGQEHPQSLVATNNLAILLKRRGKLEESAELQRRLLEISRKTSDENDPRVLIRMHNFARLLHDLGKPREAEQLYRETLTHQRRVLGDKHLHTLTTMQSLGILLKREGRFTDAESVLREALDGQRRALGDEHTDTRVTRAALADVLRRVRGPGRASTEP